MAKKQPSEILEIHCVTIDNVQTSSSVQGSVSSSSNYQNGRQQVASVSGRTDTVHASNVMANGKLYVFKQQNAQYPFMAGENMVFLCQRNEATGEYLIRSLLNNGNGTRQLYWSAKNELKPYNTFIWISVPLMLFWGIGIILLPIAIFSKLKFKKTMLPKWENIEENFLKLSGITDTNQASEILSTYDGNSIVAWK